MADPIDIDARRRARAEERDRHVRALETISLLPKEVIADDPECVQIIAREALGADTFHSPVRQGADTQTRRPT